MEFIEIKKNNDCEECIICFEDITEIPKDYKFICNHKDNMHEKCIKNLKKCPICRKITMEEAFILIEPNNTFNDLTNNIPQPTNNYTRKCKLLILYSSTCILFFVCLVLVIILLI